MPQTPTCDDTVSLPPPPAAPWRTALAWTPVAAFAGAVALLIALPVGSAWKSPVLLLALNSLFLSMVGFLVTLLAGQGYLAGQGRSVLLLGAGALALGLGALLAGLPPAQSDPNYTASVYNVAALLAGLCHLAAALRSLRRRPMPPRPTTLPLIIFYPVVVAVVILWAALARENVTPEFFREGPGATILGHAVLCAAAGLFTASAFLMWTNYRRARTAFLRWYAPALALLAVGLVGVSFQTGFGTPLNWTARATQYAGGLYMLIAAVVSARAGMGLTLSLEHALHQSEQRYQTLAEATVEGIAITANGRFLDVNDQFARLFGYAREELIGFEAAILMVPEDRERVMANILRNIESVTEHRALHKDGRVLTIETHARNMTYRGRPARLTTIHDITDRKAVEESLRRSNEELARSNADLEQFAYVASHDLQEPLRMVIGFLDLLEQSFPETLDPKARSYIAHAVEGGRRMQSLVNDLLAYSRVGRRHPFEPTDLQAVLDRALADLDARIRETSALVTRDALPTVSANSREMGQLMVNLLGNALKFRSPDRPPRIHVGADRQDGQWVVWVRDNGIGVPPDAGERIFKIFERLHARDAYEGTGIGLAICKKIVERHGGRIWVDPAEDHGAVFRFSLPSAPPA